MDSLVLFQTDDHKNVLLPEFDAGEGVPANQHVIVHGKEAMILDPGGHKVYNRVLQATLREAKGAKLRHVFLSHQDPDIVAAVNGWLMTTEADAWCPSLWTRFVPHFGLDRLVTSRLHGVPDHGMKLNLGGLDLLVIPGHFMHSPGNIMLYDPISKILYTGDLGASVGPPYRVVEDMDLHIQAMEGFHRRYMANNAVLRTWVAMVRSLDIATIAPQHGAMMVGREHVERFLSWLEGLECGTDLREGLFVLPT